MKRNVLTAVSLTLAAIMIAVAVKYSADTPSVANDSGLIAQAPGTSTGNDPSTRAALESLLDKAIKDSLEAPQPPTQGEGSSTPSTATDRLSQELFAAYVKIKQSGHEITPDVSSKIAESILAQDYRDTVTFYTAANILIQNDVSTEAIRRYGNNLATILTAPEAHWEGELAIFARLGSEPVSSYTRELNALKSRYETMRTRLLALPAPQSTARAQAEVANSITLFISAINGAMSLDDDPVGSITKIAEYESGLQMLNNAVMDYTKFFQSQKVIFSAQEAGYIFVD